MNGSNYVSTISKKIVDLRKSNGFTQESLAEKLGVTFQAVSKWENGLSCPDISLLPELADVFGVTIDILFGRVVTAQDLTTQITSDLPLEDDDVLRVIVFKGLQIVDVCNHLVHDFTFTYHGEALNVERACSITCEAINGDAKAGLNIQCDDIGGNDEAGENITCQHVGGYVIAKGNVHCGVVGAHVVAGRDVNCGGVGTHVIAGENVQCGGIGAYITVGGNVHCGNVDGDVNAGGDVSCENIHGNVTYKGKIDYKTMGTEPS